MSEPLRTVLMTAPDAETGESIGRRLVEERLAACANVISGVTSVYWWEGAVQRDSEALVIMKTRASVVEALAERVVALHPYEVPEVLALPVLGGFEPYIDWVRRETGPRSAG